MGHHRDKQRGGGSVDSGDLETLRERVLDHPEDEDRVSGNDIDNTASTGPIKVVVRQDGIGRTGGIVLGIFAGLAFGVACATAISYKVDLIEVRSAAIRESNLSARERDKLSAEVAKSQLETAHILERLSDDSRIAERESRMLQYYLLELDAKVIKAGIKPQSEAISTKLQKEPKP